MTGLNDDTACEVYYNKGVANRLLASRRYLTVFHVKARIVMIMMMSVRINF